MPADVCAECGGFEESRFVFADVGGEMREEELDDDEEEEFLFCLFELDLLGDDCAV